jgi:hypothetical protein
MDPPDGRGQPAQNAGAMRAGGGHGLLELQVAQLSESFGPGLFRKFRFTA